MAKTTTTYEVLARKWRPQQFGDVVGQEHVTQTLRNAIEADRIAHAYLFVGPRGIGKTSLARIFAKALNCSGGKGPTATPCDACESCKEIARGTGLDVMEIDGASNNGVEQVRELRDTVKYLPVHSRYKIIIIDEVHMLSASAFNALLKTLEEPPAHVKFFFATTEPDKVLATIVSRCQRFDLRRIPVGRISERLRDIARAEKITIDDDAILAIARGSDGGLRDAESALDQLIAFRGMTIREADVLAVFGLTSRETIERLTQAIFRGDVAALMQLVAELDGAGKDLQRLVVDLLRVFRDLLVCLNIKDPGESLELSSGSPAWLSKMAQQTDVERVLRTITLFLEAEDRMRYALSRRTLLEVTLVRASRAATVVTLDEILRQLQELRRGEPTEPEGGTRSPARSAPGAGAVASSGPSGGPVAPVSGPVAEAEGLLARLVSGWSRVVEQAAKVSLQVRAGLKDARPVVIDGDRVRVTVDAEFAGEIKVLEHPRNRKAIEHALSVVAGMPLHVELAVAGAGDTRRVDGGTSAAGSPGKVAEPAGGPSGAGGKDAREWVKDPAVKKLLDTFGGGIVEIR